MMLYLHPMNCARFSGITMGVRGGGVMNAQGRCIGPSIWENRGDFDEISWFEDKWR